MTIRLFKELEKARKVLIAGAGGGFDVFCGLPIYCWLRRTGRSVELANLSFSELGFCDGERPTPALMRVLSSTNGPSNYFPELYLAQWLSKRFGETSVYAIDRIGVEPVAAAYAWLAKEFEFDTVILVDGGVDSVMRGDEAGLGTPQEDVASLFAANALRDVERRFLVAIGFGIDAFHGVCHAHFLENTAALIVDGAFLGSWSLERETEDFQLYKEACEFVAARMPRQPSIVNASIVSAVDGWFGDYHATKRTEGSELFINPLMAVYWAFQLESVAKRNLYLDRIGNTKTYQELSLEIEKFRASQPKTRTWTDIPC